MKKVKKMCAVLHRGEPDEKRVYIGKQTGRVVFEASQLQKDIMNMETREQYDEVVNTVCGWYDGLTYDDIMDKMDSRDLIPFLYDSCTFLIESVVGVYNDLLNLANEEDDAEKNAEPAADEKAAG